MADRIEQEIALLLKYHPHLKVDEGKKWILIPDYALPVGMGWSKTTMDICIEIRTGYPGTPPYGIYVPNDLSYNGNPPLNWQPNAKNKPTFPGNWAMISWSPHEPWKPGPDVVSGGNLLNFILSFSDRFKDGR